MKRILLLAAITICFVAQMSAQGLFQGFEQPWTNGAPQGWTATQVAGTQDWAQKKIPLVGQARPKGGKAASDSSVAWFPSGPSNAGNRTRLESPAMDFTGFTHPTVSFSYVNKTGNDSLYIQYSLDGGTNWIDAAGYGATADTSWKTYLVSLEVASGLANVKIGVEAVSDTSLSDIWVDNVRAQAYARVSVRQIQEVPADSLALANTIQLSNGARWTLQTSPFNGDTVTVTGLCLAPAKLITYTAGGWTMILYDTAQINQFRGLFVRCNAPADTAQLLADGFLNVAAGDVIEVTGVISEFPTGNMNSLTQFQPIAGIPISIISSNNPVPAPTVKKISDFFTGISGAGTAKVQFSTGEPFESMYIELHNVTIDANVNFNRGTFSMVDSAGNQLSDYDYSHFFTKGHGGSLPYPGDTTWMRIYPDLVGTTIDTIRGIIGTSSGSENARGYRICPLYMGDIVLGKVYPSLSTHRRYPVLVTADSTVRVSVKAAKRPLGYGLASVTTYYSLNNASFVPVTMTYQASDTTYNGTIPKQAAGTFVHYFVQVVDSASNVVTLANSGTSAISADTANGFFFYTVSSGRTTIHDVQYTPYTNGRSGLLGATVSVSGIVTADTAHIGISPSGTAGYGTNAWYIQSTNQPWSGIWVVGTDSTLKTMANGDSVTVTGTVLEEQTGASNNVTRINVTAPVVKHSSGNPEPAPIALTTGAFMYGVANGSASAEPYEGMLVKFNNLTVTNINPTFSDPTEFDVNDGTGAIAVRRDGRNTYSNVEADSIYGKRILRVGDRIGSLTGVIFYSFNQYKVVPRTNADFQSVTNVTEKSGRALPTSYAITQNYPNPFNPATTIEFAVPTSGLVSLKVYNLLGQEVASLVDDVKAAGTYTVRFDASRLSSGVYFYRIQAGAFNQVKKMMLLK